MTSTTSLGQILGRESHNVTGPPPDQEKYCLEIHMLTLRSESFYVWQGAHMDIEKCTYIYLICG